MEKRWNPTECKLQLNIVYNNCCTRWSGKILVLCVLKVPNLWTGTAFIYRQTDRQTDRFQLLFGDERKGDNQCDTAGTAQVRHDELKHATATLHLLHGCVHAVMDLFAVAPLGCQFHLENKNVRVTIHTLVADEVYRSIVTEPLYLCGTNLFLLRTVQQHRTPQSTHQHRFLLQLLAVVQCQYHPSYKSKLNTTFKTVPSEEIKLLATLSVTKK